MSPKMDKQRGTSSATEINGVPVSRRTAMSTNLNDPKQISERGEEIYNRLYKSEYEQKYGGQYVAININDESSTLAATASEALAEAKKKNPHGFFHLIRVGHPSAFQVGLAYRNVS